MRKQIATLAGLVLLAATLPAAAEAGVPKMKRAKFKVTVDGVQNTTWKVNHVGTGGCDGDFSGAGTEKVRFTSKPRTLSALYFKGLSNPILSVGRSGATIGLRGKVTRAGKINAAPGLCGGTGGGNKVAPDCGAKSIRGAKVSLEYLLNSKRRVGLGSYYGMSDPFRNCPSNGYSFPTVLDRNSNDSRIGSKLPIGELFDRKLGKIILIGRGKLTKDDGEAAYTTSIKWVVTLERIGKRR